MNEETMAIYEFLKSKGYVDEDLGFKEIELKISTDGLPEIKVTYDLIQSNIKEVTE